MAELPGDVYSGGRRIGRTADLEATFLDAVVRAKRAGPVYIVASSDSPPEFLERCRALCPVVAEPSLDDAALIVSGYPSEWSTLGS